MKKSPLIAFLLGALICGAAAPWSNIASEQRKAERIYICAANDYDAATDFLLLKYANKIDPNNLNVKSQLAKYLIITGYDEGDTDPDVLFQSLVDAYLANPLDKAGGEESASLTDRCRYYGYSAQIYAEMARQYPNDSEVLLSYGDALAQYAVFEEEDSVQSGCLLDSVLGIIERVEALTGVTPYTISRRTWDPLRERQDSTALVKLISNYAATDRNDATTMAITGNLFEFVNLPDSVIYYYNRACELDSTIGYPHVQLANYYLNELNDTARYNEQVMKVLRSPGLEFEDKEEMLREYSVNLLETEVDDTVLSELYEYLLELHPSEPTVYTLYGLVKREQGYLAAAADLFQYSIAINPNDEFLYDCLTNIAWQMEDTTLLINTLQTSFEQFGNINKAVTASAFMGVSGHNEEGIRYLQGLDLSAVEEDAEGMSSYYQQIGDLYHALDLNDSTYIYYDKSLDYNPGNDLTLNNYAYFLTLYGGDLDKALDMIRRADMYNPDVYTYLDTYAWVLFKRKDYKGAREKIDRAISLALEVVNDTTVVEEMVVSDTAAVVEESPGDLTIEEVEAAETLSAEILDHAGDIYFMNGEPEQALRFWERALALDPENEKIKKKVKNKTYFFE